MAVDDILIVGGGLAGATAAKTLRAEGFSGPVTVLAAEPHIPYQRPPLSKDYLLGRAADEVLPVVPAEWYAANDVSLRLASPVTRLVPAGGGGGPGGEVELADGSRLAYAAVLLATGAQPRTIGLPGSGLEGVSSFRTVEDSRRLRSALSAGGRNVVMVGSGWIGMELASAATAYGNHVTLLGLEDVPLSAAIGPELGRFSAPCTRTTVSGSGCRPPRPRSRARPEKSRGSAPTRASSSRQTW